MSYFLTPRQGSRTLTAQDFIDVIRLHAQGGVDFVTLHRSITPQDHRPNQEAQAEDEHYLPGQFAGLRPDVHDRGGEPFYEYYDEILDICREYDGTCSMCGKFCTGRSMHKALSGEHIDIL